MVSKENARTLWLWKGDAELAEVKSDIHKLKLNMQRYANRLASGKGDTRREANRLHILSGALVEKMRQLETVLSVKEMAEL